MTCYILEVYIYDIYVYILMSNPNETVVSIYYYI